MLGELADILAPLTQLRLSQVERAGNDTGPLRTLIDDAKYFYGDDLKGPGGLSEERAKILAANQSLSETISELRAEVERVVPTNYKRSDNRPLFSRSTKYQTQTPAFRAWFGDSKVVDADGQPLVVYHGTNDWHSS